MSVRGRRKINRSSKKSGFDPWRNPWFKEDAVYYSQMKKHVEFEEYESDNYEDIQIDEMSDDCEDPWAHESETTDAVFEDDSHIRVLPKDSLLQKINEDLMKIEETDKNLGFDWTQKDWRKAGNNAPSKPQNSVKKEQIITNSLKGNKIHANLEKALAEPVKMTKAESMMQKMGWQGGGLGKERNGILTPIVPNAVYASASKGFGIQTEEVTPTKITKKPQKKKKPEKQNLSKLQKRRINKREKNECLQTNVLKEVLQFVKDNSEIELYFDHRFQNGERKFIHQMIESYREGRFNIQNKLQGRYIQEIDKYNIYNLLTISVGEKPNRKLCLYKEEPDHIYLVTPKDMMDEIETVDITDNDDTDVTEIQNEQKEPINEINNVTKSITENFNKDCSIIPNIMDKLLEFLKEFVDTDDYTEFRFLGRFDNNEIDAINQFFQDVYYAIANDDSQLKNARLKDILNSDTYKFELKEELEDRIVIYKHGKP